MQLEPKASVSEERKEMTPQEKALARERVGPLLLRLAFPAIVAQLVNALYNIIDRIYIGNIPEQGGRLLTGVGVTFAIIMVINASASLIGSGGAPLLTMHLGEGDKEAAAHVLNQAFIYLLLLAVIIMPAIWLTQDRFLYWFGASEVTFAAARNYLTIYTLGTPFVMISLGMNAFINAQGFTSLGMRTVLVGAVANLILDPIFIFGLGLNESGAAIATVISQALSAAYVLRVLTGGRLAVSLQPVLMRRIDWKTFGRIVALGLAPFVMSSTEGLLQVVQNSTLQRYGGDAAVGAMVIIGSIMQFILLPTAGLTRGAQPIISYNYGALQFDRVRAAVRKLVMYCVIWVGSMFLLVQLFPGAFVRIFNSDPEMIRFTSPLLRLYMLGMIFMGLQISLQNSFVALGQAKRSIALAMLRKLILLIPLILILPLWFGYRAVFFAEAIVDFTAAAVTTIVFVTGFRSILDARRRAVETRRGG
ncbi:MAG: MATE family efflux transporter [Bacillota bacterium]|nr:MATE family efflux transporter [Bacillota bacterium]